MPLNTPEQVSVASLLDFYIDTPFDDLCSVNNGQLRIVDLFQKILAQQSAFEEALTQPPAWIKDIESRHEGHFLYDSNKTERFLTAVLLEVLSYGNSIDCRNLIDHFESLKRGLPIRLVLYFEYKLHQEATKLYENMRLAFTKKPNLGKFEKESTLFSNKTFMNALDESATLHEIRALQSETPTIFFEMLIDALNFLHEEDRYPCYLDAVLKKNNHKILAKRSPAYAIEQESAEWRTIADSSSLQNGAHHIYRLLTPLKMALTVIKKWPKGSFKQYHYNHIDAVKYGILLKKLTREEEISLLLARAITAYIIESLSDTHRKRDAEIPLLILGDQLTKETILTFLKNQDLFVFNLKNTISFRNSERASPYFKIHAWKIVLFRFVDTLVSYSSHKDKFTKADIMEMHIACLDLLRFTARLCEKIEPTEYDQTTFGNNVCDKIDIARYAIHQTKNDAKSIILQRYLTDVVFEKIENDIDHPQKFPKNMAHPDNITAIITISEDGTLTQYDTTIIAAKIDDEIVLSYQLSSQSITSKDSAFVKAYAQSEDLICTLFKEYLPLDRVSDFSTQVDHFFSPDIRSDDFESIHRALLKLSEGYQKGLLPLKLTGLMYLHNKRDKLLAKEAKTASISDRLFNYQVKFGALSESPRKNLLQYERMDRSFIFSSDHLKSHGLALTEIILKNDLTTVTFSLRLKSQANSSEKSVEISSALLSAITSIADHEQVIQCSIDKSTIHIKVDPSLRSGFLDESFSPLVKINDPLSEPLTEADYLTLSRFQDNDTRISGFDESHIRSILMTYFERADLWEKARLEYPVTLTEVLAALKNEYEAGKPTKKHLRYDIRLIRGEYETHATCLMIDHEKKSIHHFDSLGDNDDTLSAHDLPSSFDDYSLTFNNTKTQEDDFGCFAQVAHHIICTLHPDEALSPAERQERAQLGTDSVKLMNHYWRYVKLHQTMALDNKRAYTHLLNGLREVYRQVKESAGLNIEAKITDSSPHKQQKSGYLRADLYSLILAIQKELGDSTTLATSIPLVFLAVFIRDNPDNLLARYIHLALRNPKSPLSQRMLALSLSVSRPNTDALIEVLSKLIAKMSKVKVALLHHEASGWRTYLQVAFQDAGMLVDDINMVEAHNLDLVHDYDLLAIPGTLPGKSKIIAQIRLRYIAVIKQAYTANVPMFGECFGHQTLYAALTDTSIVTIQSTHPEQESTHFNPLRITQNLHQISCPESSYFTKFEDFKSPTTSNRAHETRHYLTDSAHSFSISVDDVVLNQKIIHIDATTGDVPEAFTSTATVGNSTHALVLGTQFHSSNYKAIEEARMPGFRDEGNKAFVEDSLAFQRWILLERLETAKFCRFFKKKEKSMAKAETLAQRKMPQ